MIVPPDAAAIIEFVCDQERRWFEANPTATQYTRAYVPGEFSPLDIADCQLTHGQEPPANALIRVRQIAPGIRTRGMTIPDEEPSHAA